MIVINQNDLEEDVAEDMAGLWPTEELGNKELENKIVEGFRKTAAYQRGNYNLGNLMQYLPNLWLRYVLEIMQEKYQRRIIISQMPEDEQTKPFSSDDRDGLWIVKADGKDYSKINRVAMIDGLPVLFDIRIGRFKERRNKRRRGGNGTSSRKKYSTSASSRGVSYALRGEAVNHVIEPVSRYASMVGCNGTKCGYVLFIADGKRTKRSAVVRKFRGRNGILRLLPRDREGAREDIERICRENKISYRAGGFNAYRASGFNA